MEHKNEFNNELALTNEVNDDDLLDDIMIKYSKKDTKLGDIILFQFFVCLVIILALIAVKIVDTDMADKIFADIKESVGSETDVLMKLVDYLKELLVRINA